MMTDPIADMLARIRNAGMRRFECVDIPSSNIKKGILGVLQREGYINGFSEYENDGKQYLRANLRYYDNALVIKVLDKVSKPGRRVYSRIKKLPSVFNGFGIFILSTSKGIMSDAEAKVQNLGGEVLCKVF